MTVAATQSLGPSEASESRPAIVAWKWYYHASGAPLWALVALLVIGPQANRHRQAWLIFLPLAAVALISRMLTRLFMTPEVSAEWFGIVSMSCAMAWAAVWTVGHWLAALRPVARFFAALVLMLAVGAVSCWSYLGLENGDDMLSATIGQGMASIGLLLSTMLVGRACHLKFRRGQFMRWLFVYMMIVAAAIFALFAITMLFVFEMGLHGVVPVLISMAVTSPIVAGILFLFNVPFMLLAFNSPFYRARFGALFCREGSCFTVEPAAEVSRVGQIP